MEQVQDGIAAVAHQHQGAVRQPAAELQNHLAGPVSELFMRAAPGAGNTVPGRQCGQHRQGPIPPGPGYAAQPHESDPAQAAGLDHVAVAGAHRVPVNAKGADLRTLTPLQCLVNAEHQGAVALVKMLNQQPQQYPGHQKGRPRGAVEHMMIAGIVAVATQTHDTEGRGHRASAWRQYRANQQDLGFLPGRAPKQCCEGDEDR